MDEGLHEKVNIIHEPSIEFDLKPDIICGNFKRYHIGPNNSSLLFNLVLNYATKAHKLISTNERNMSSMVSPITILGDSDKVDIKLAKKLGIPAEQSKHGVLLEVNAIIDCGADTCVTDAQLRKVLGRDGLPPARGLLQGEG